ncbi:MAG: SPASM domain-containing protein [Ruegeria sp.]|nr:SPASM domain-containing protein [Ruegeria sp.]
MGLGLDLVPWYVTMAAAMDSIQNDHGFLYDMDGADCSAIIQSLSDKNATYLRRRRLLDGPDAHAKDLVIECAEEIRQNNSQAFVDLLLAQVSENVSDQTIFTLLVAGWLELQRGQWQATETLGREVVSRDHHDLMAQRLIDAAREASRDLETETDRWLQTRTCPAPFREMETRVNGEVHFCCSAWQPVPIGRLETADEGGFWNSDRAREIRRSVRDGDFSHCSRWHCPQIAGRRLPARSPETQDEKLELDKGPDRVILSHDRSCNISCPSCRTKLINLPHKDTERLNKVFEDHLLPLVSNAKKIKVTGSGDPFGSRHFRHVLAQLTAAGQPGRRIQLHTNGLLANERAWNDLGLWGHVSSVWVSIDAAEPDTYSVLRRGGDFATLKKNLRFLGNLNARGDIDTLRFDFVVQAANYKEMPAFADLAHEMNADGVYFLRLRNWGHVTPREFKNQDVCSSDHPEHKDLLAVLSDERLAWSGVDLGSLNSI